MKVIDKKHKKIDCVLFYDEIDMLLFRLNELDEFVDYFVIMECELDFKGNRKKLFFEENKELFKKWGDKIIHIVSKNINKDFVDAICEKTKFAQYTQFKTPELTKNDIIYCQIHELYNFLMSFDLLPEDIVLFSHVDEIPNFLNFNSIINSLNFEPIILSQKNFIWSTEYYNPTPHVGTCCFLFSSLIQSPNKIYQIYDTKKNRLLGKTVCQNGFHFSHFYSLEKTIKKLNLLSDNEKISENVTNCFNNLISIVDYDFEMPCGLIEYDGELPKNHSLLPSQKIGRDYSKKYTITLNFNKVDSTFNLNVHFNEDNQFDILLPTSKYYDVLIEDNTLENFQKMYGVNEIKKIISSFYPLNQDLFRFVNDGKFIEYLWSELKDKFIYDRIKDIL
jgi:beta-1,4-mannosyl-glycoprotein beta-1,4-N-acetylglucosaminyltransferase